MHKVTLSVLAVLILAVIGSAYWFYSAFFYSTPLNETELADLTPDWTRVTNGNWSPWHTLPDGTTEWNPAASFNAWLATVPEEDKAWPIVIDVILANPDLFEHEDLGDYPQESDQWDELVDLLKTPESQDAIKQLKEAFSRPVMGCGMYNSTGTYEHQALLRYGLEDENWNPSPVPNPKLMDIFLPPLGKFRTTTYLFKSDAISKLENNDPDGFIELIDVMYTASDLATEHTGQLSQLVKIAVQSIINDLIMWSLENYSKQFTDQHLSRLASIIEQAGIHTLRWEGDAMVFHDTFRRIFDANGKANPAAIQSLQNGNSLQTNPLDTPDSQLHASIQRPIYMYSIVGKHAELRSEVPADFTLKPTEQINEQELTKLNEISRLLAGILIPAFDKAAARFQGSTQQIIGTQTLIAIHRQKLRYHSFPESLDEIDPDLLIINPMDIYTGDRLHYKLSDDGPMLYALGNDLDDDNGRYNESVLSITKPIDADWPMFSSQKLNELYPDD